MSDGKEAVLDRLRKIQALAQQGVGGERENAQRMLETALKRHGLTLADLGGTETKDWYEFEYRGEWERKLLIQTASMVANMKEYRHAKRNRTKLEFELTLAERVELEITFDVLKAAFQEQMGEFFTAFLLRNRVFWPSERDEDAPEPERTPEQRARAKRISLMALGLVAVDRPTKRIENAPHPDQESGK
jgi:hypothetical protein